MAHVEWISYTDIRGMPMVRSQGNMQYGLSGMLGGCQPLEDMLRQVIREDPAPTP